MKLIYMINLLKQLSKSFANFVYPPLCLQCKNLLKGKEIHFCIVCSSQFELIDPSDRCPQCFSLSFNVASHRCLECIRIPQTIYKMAAAYDYYGPAACLIRKIKYCDQPHFALGLGSAMAIQFLNLGWPKPDFIIPVPISYTHWLDRGYNQSLLLAEEFSRIIDAPILDILERNSGDYSQAGLTRKQRLLLEGKNIILKKKGDILQDTTILLIDDVMTTGSTLRKCAEVLFQGHPEKIFALAACRAIK